LWLIEQRQGGTPPVLAGGAIFPALLVAALMAFPWVVWGALGSWLDTVLNLTAAAFLGISAGRTLTHSLFPSMKGSDGTRGLAFFLGGLAGGVTLLAMGTAFGHNGQQLILLFLLPAI